MKKKAMGIALAVGMLVSGAAAGIGFNGEAQAKKAGHDSSSGKVKNVIYMIPDGFNGAYATNYRWYNGGESSFDPYVKGLMMTYSSDTEVTDSAAAATAMATGVKTKNGMIGVTADGKEVHSILDAAEKAGKSTGLVATATITHATPAGFGASVVSRGDEAEIAPQYFDNGVDVILGGGRNYFIPAAEGGKQPDSNLIAEAEKNGYQYVENASELAKAKGSKVLGLFAAEAMAPELEREGTGQPSLLDMTEAAIAALKKDKDGFFLMVEGSQIDWAGHAHDAAWAMTDTEAFDKAVEAALKFAEKDGNTLVVVAGDHETGGMSVGSNGLYDLNIDVLHQVKATGNQMASELNANRSNVKEVVKKHTGFDLTDDEAAKIAASSTPHIAINEVVSDRALVGWTSVAHTGVDLPVYAYGPYSHVFSGLLNNTDLPKLMAKAMKLKLGN